MHDFMSIFENFTGRKNMTDLHCHILPGVDDGAPDLAQALEMARMAAMSGVRAIVATPHCNLPHTEPQNYLDPFLLKRIVDLRGAIEAAQIPLRLYAGAEIFCTPELESLLQSNQLLPLAGSKYLLMEFFFDESPDFMNACFQTAARQGFIPVIAHPERYESVQRAPMLVQDWFAQGYIIQLNKGSVLGSLGGRAKTASQWILQRGLAHAVASDAHGTRMRTPHMGEIRQHLETFYAPEYARILLSTNPGRIVRDLSVLRA